MNSISHWGFTDGRRLSQTVGQYLQNRSNPSGAEFITAAEKALAQDPNEWVICFTLADKYQAVGRYADALTLTKRCVDLKPNDIRSVYAHATSYNMLSRAGFQKAESSGSMDLASLLIAGAALASSGMQQGAHATTDHIDPKAAAEELKKTGMDAETVAIQAIRWFEAAVQLGPDAQSRAQIDADLAALYRRFPHLRR